MKIPHLGGIRRKVELVSTRVFFVGNLQLFFRKLLVPAFFLYTRRC